MGSIKCLPPCHVTYFLALTHCHWLISIRTDSVVKMLKPKVNCYWLISSRPTRLYYRNSHWLISINTDPIVKLLKMKANCYWLISNDPTTLTFKRCHWLISINVHPIVKLKGLYATGGNQVSTPMSRDILGKLPKLVM